MRFILVFLLACLAACQSRPVIVPGTSLELAQERKAAIREIVYRLHFIIPESRTDSIRANLNLSFELTDVQGPVQLDFTPSSTLLKSILINGRPTEVDYENEHLLLSASYLNKGSNHVEINFMAGEAALNRHDDYLYTLFVPARAATCFPSFDQPDLKARYELQLTLPLSWEAVSQGKVTKNDTTNGSRTLAFSPTQPTSTYQFAFAVGKFRKVSDGNMTMYYRETDSLKVARNAGKIFQLHRESIDWMTQYTGIPYPYEKFDFALMPAFQFGGMEHPGNIFYREGSLLLDAPSSINEELRRASLIAHETAHMWFGNLVTMEWFNDVWLKEVFANFMAAKIVNPSFPEVNHELRFLMAHYPGAYEVDRSKGTHPIQQPLSNLKRAGSVYGAIIYQKAPIMMRNLEFIVGEKDFQEGIQEYLKTFRYGNATWNDLIGTIAKQTTLDLKEWNESWILKGGRPEIELKRVKEGWQPVARNASPGQTWPQSYQYLVVEGDRSSVQTITPRQALLAAVDTNRLNFIPNFGGRGYGYFSADASNKAYMLKRVFDFPAPQQRAGIWMNQWEYLLAAETKPTDLLLALLGALPKEEDPLLLEYITDRITRIYWQFITQAERELLAGPVAQAFHMQLVTEKEVSLKRTFFNAYRETALLGEDVRRLETYWKEHQAEGLPLSERDRIQMAYALALRGNAKILEEQIAQITNPDKLREVKFVSQALAADDSLRRNFFESLKSPSNRTQEPWVLEGLRLLHHPLRSQSSSVFIPESLAMLEELQRTGDIFFPKGWLDSVLGLAQDPATAQMVNDYLTTHPDLPPDLRNKVLQSADMLYRAAAITRTSDPLAK